MKLTTRYNKNEISHEWIDEITGKLVREVIDLKERNTRKALKALGWKPPRNLPKAEGQQARASHALLGEVLALTRYDPTSSGYYGSVYMVKEENGEYLDRDEVLELIRKHFA